ncbi:UNVERIFIED_CONTAM: hypothetical protein B566_EDAN011729 [Ephemera danica]|nr:hypothetical protein B566_EDAN011729 [Ephemera danica]
MATPSKVSDNGIELLKKFEGCKTTAYKGSDNVWTIGYGHTGPEVVEGLKITQQQATDYLKSDLTKFENIVSGALNKPVNQNQFDALVVFSYNIGGTAFKNSTALEMINAGKYDAVPEAMEKWNKVKGVVSQGLQNRRAAEVDLWNTPETQQVQQSQQKQSAGTPSESGPTPGPSSGLLTDPAHAGNGLYRQAMNGLTQLNEQCRIPVNQQTHNLAACLAVSAYKDDLRGITAVLPSTDGGTHMFASDKTSARDVFGKQTQVPTEASMNTPMTQSTEAWNQVAQEKTQAQAQQKTQEQTQQQTQEQTSQRQASAFSH